MKIQKILGYKVEEEDKELILVVIKRVLYDHPDAIGQAYLTVPEEYVEKRVREGDRDYPALKLLQMAQLNLGIR